MARHWTYTDLDPGSDLRQGDVLEPTTELRVLFEQVHRHFADPKYLSFIVITQTCDLVRRDGVCSARHINLAAVKSLQAVLLDLLDHECERLAPGCYAEESRNKANLLLSRICNQNEPGLFYLYPEGEIGIGEDAVAQLRVSVAFRVNHYDVLRKARRGCLTAEFAARLGWLMGNLYSRVAVTDWSEGESRRNELKRIIKAHLSSSDAKRGPCWIRHAAVAHLAKEGVDLSALSREQVTERVKQIKVPRPKDTAVDRVLEAAREVIPGVPLAQLERLKSRLKSDPVFESVLKSY